MRDNLSQLGDHFQGATPLNATVTDLGDGTWRVTPTEDFFGTLTLRYALKNETGFEVPTTVEVEVIGTPDAPEARDDTVTLAEDTPQAIFVTQLLASDRDVDRQAVQITRILETEGVTVELTGDRQIPIAPDPERIGPAFFTCEIADFGGVTDTAQVDITIEAVNDAPAVTGIGTLFGAEDTDLAIVLPSNAITDADGDALVVELRGPGRNHPA